MPNDDVFAELRSVGHQLRDMRRPAKLACQKEPDAEKRRAIFRPRLQVAGK